MARKKRRKAGKRKSKQNMSGFTGMVLGLVIGLSVAVYVYVGGVNGLSLPRASQASAAAQPQPVLAEPRKQAEEPAPEPGITFDFYDMLPNLDVPVYVDDRTVAQRPAQVPVTTPGVYIVQAGSFGTLQDANRRKVQIALLGVHSEIKRGNANERTVYRVYTDPMEDPNEVNRVSQLLRDNGIEILRKRVSE